MGAEKAGAESKAAKEMKSMILALPECLHSLLFELSKLDGRAIQDLVFKAVKQYASAILRKTI